MDAETRKLLDPRAIARAEALGMNARFIVEGYMAGEHKSPYRGFAIEFAQHRWSLMELRSLEKCNVSSIRATLTKGMPRSHISTRSVRLRSTSDNA